MERLNEWPIADERSLAREACRIFYGYGEDFATPTNHDLAAMQAVLKWYESVLPRGLPAGSDAGPITWSPICAMCKRVLDEQDDSVQDTMTLLHHDMQLNAALGAKVCTRCGRGELAARSSPCAATAVQPSCGQEQP